jgi:sugar-specific transcriptional regulator TrmB
LSEETIRKLLRDVGLTEKEAEVYIFLGKHGALKGLEIAKRIKKHKAQVYNILKNLQSKGLVESTLEFPARFTAVPFETVINLSIKAKRDEAAFIENAKKEILGYWKTIGHPELERPLEKFVVIEGSNKIYSKISQMAAETKNQFLAFSTVSGLLSAYRYGLFDATHNHPFKSNVQFRLIIEFSEQELTAVKNFLKMQPQTELDLRGKTPSLGVRLSPRMAVRDEEELVLFVTQRADTSEDQQDETCLWTNCKTLVLSFTSVFREMWRNATDIEEKIVEIEASKVTPRAFDVGDAENARAAYDKIIQSAKDAVTIVTSAKGLVDLAKNMPLYKELVTRGVAIKILAPVTRENFGIAQELLKICEVRHIPTDYIETTLVDGQHLFQFRHPSADQQYEGVLRFENMIYITDYELLKKIKAILDDFYKNACSPSRSMLQSIASPPAIAVAPPNKTRWSEYGKTMSPAKGQIGGLTVREVLDKIINAQKSPAEKWEDTITFYGSRATAVIHPPDFFDLPDMILSIYHNNKQSSFGGEDFMIISLWLETPRGHAYIPAALITDNPLGEALRKSVWAGTPVEQNFQIVKKDEFHVRVQGSTLFAGWTVAIPLLPSKYTLPPACVLFEGYGKLVSGVSKTVVPSGRKVTTEYNGLEAFVTFFHPSSKYSGPGTDGLFARDAVTTSVA